jgi:hypothetical protein
VELPYGGPPAVAGRIGVPAVLALNIVFVIHHELALNPNLFADMLFDRVDGPLGMKLGTILGRHFDDDRNWVDDFSRDSFSTLQVRGDVLIESDIDMKVHVFMIGIIIQLTIAALCALRFGGIKETYDPVYLALPQFR